MTLVRGITTKAGHLRMWACVLVFVLLSGSTLTSPVLAQSGGTVRGRLIWRTNSGDYPAAYLPVKLLLLDGSRSLLAYTDADGFYYFYNIPSGDYLLWIYPRANSNPLRYRIRIFNQPYTDISPIFSHVTGRGFAWYSHTSPSWHLLPPQRIDEMVRRR